jgi:hypothetical protein
MTNSPYLFFHKSPEQLRRLGARGGKAHGRNQRARRARIAPPPQPAPAAALRETTAQAMALLDAQFPWLRTAANRGLRPGSPRSLPADRT